MLWNRVRFYGTECWEPNIVTSKKPCWSICHLAQLVEHWTRVQEIRVRIPVGPTPLRERLYIRVMNKQYFSQKKYLMIALSAWNPIWRSQIFLLVDMSLSTVVSALDSRPVEPGSNPGDTIVLRILWDRWWVTGRFCQKVYGWWVVATVYVPRGANHVKVGSRYRHWGICCDQTLMEGPKSSLRGSWYPL